jgi:hypothetical protein
MDIRGVVYDVGTVYSGAGWSLNTRPRLDPAVAHRELEIIRHDLHCNAVRIRGRDIRRLIAVAGDALQQGLEVWLSPELFGKKEGRTLGYLIKAATAAEGLSQQWPDRMVFSVGSEATLFMRGIVAGRSIQERAASLIRDGKLGTHAGPLNAFLARANESVRGAFHGRVTYAALPFEPVEWSLFDIVGVDHYRDARVKDRYASMLKPLFTHGKPVVVTEFGMRAYKGADTSGALGFGIIDQRSVFLHQLPLIGRFVSQRLIDGDFTRDENLQARELIETLTILDAEHVHGAFVCEFVSAAATVSEDPKHDLDMSAMSLVKSYADTHGTTYPDLAWEPKESFKAVAGFYATQTRG